jgi:hypothetical protein
VFDIRPESFELLANDKKTGTHSQSNRAGGSRGGFYRRACDAAFGLPPADVVYAVANADGA